METSDSVTCSPFYMVGRPVSDADQQREHGGGGYPIEQITAPAHPPSHPTAHRTGLPACLPALLVCWCDSESEGGLEPHKEAPRSPGS